ncbi:MAG: sigma-70 family RNA polymerase sigma factor [Planctomycetales bacterium]|nr:sigma-70 family RNA polymerase sigma factor [Planctomycetales bacterium]
MPNFPDTHSSLIERVKDLSDGASWIEFLGIYQPVVFRMATRRGLQNADAEDVMQQVFTSIARSIDDWTGGPNEPPFRAWLSTIARNAITKSLARQPVARATGRSSMFALLHEYPDPVATMAEVGLESRKELVRWATEQIKHEFSVESWDVFWRTSINGDSIENVAATTGRSAGSIYVIRYRVISRLKEKVSEVSEHWDIHEAPPSW